MNTDKKTTLGTEPLRNRRYEQFAQHIVAGATQIDAYKATSPRKVKPSSAAPAASRIAARGDVSARVAFLRIQKKAAEERTTAQIETQPTRTPPDTTELDSGAPLTRDELERRLASAVRTGETPEVVQAAKMLQTIRPDLGGGNSPSRGAPDPVHVIEYVCSFAGMAGADIVRQLGGWPFLRSKLCAVLRVTDQELRDGLAM